MATNALTFLKKKVAYLFPVELKPKFNYKLNEYLSPEQVLLYPTEREDFPRQISHMAVKGKRANLVASENWDIDCEDIRGGREQLRHRRDKARMKHYLTESQANEAWTCFQFDGHTVQLATGEYLKSQ